MGRSGAEVPGQLKPAVAQQPVRSGRNAQRPPKRFLFASVEMARRLRQLDGENLCVQPRVNTCHWVGWRLVLFPALVSKVASLPLPL
jgi:hypothetical protein